MDRLILRDVARTPLVDALPIFASLVSPLTGVIPVPQDLLPMTNGSPWTNPNSIRHGAGCDVSHATAFAAVVGEGCTRYAATLIDEDRVRVATADELGAAAAPPESFALFHPRQYAQTDFPYVPFQPDTRIRWTPAFRLAGGERAFVPTQLTSLGTAFHGEPRLGYATRSGLACGPTFEEAVLAGLLELVARDAFMLMWSAALSLPLVDCSGDAGLVVEAQVSYHSSGLHYHAVDLSVFNMIPTALGVVRDLTGDGALAVGCASAPTMSEAVGKALRDAFETRASARQLRTALPDWRCPSFDHIEEGEDHILYYAHEAGAAQAAFIDGSMQRVRIADIRSLAGDSVLRHIRAIVERLGRSGIDVYVVDTTPPDLRCAGLSTVAVVAPQLCRLDVPYRFRYLGGRRLYRAARELGLVAGVPTIDDLNPLPHPFP